MNPKLSSTVSVVRISDTIIEFFKTNTRQHIYLKVQDDTVLEIVLSLDGSKSEDEIAAEFNIKQEDVIKLVSHLRKNGVLDNILDKDMFQDYERYRRPIHFLNDYSSSQSDLLNMWDNIRTSTVLIIGLGAVGSWVACNLAQSGIMNFILMDPDVIEVTNLHRQFGYTQSDIGKLKTDVLERRLKEYYPKVNVFKVNSYLDDKILYDLDIQKVDLIVNCADKPSVDKTSLWIGEFAMKHDIPHIIGGGYNMHLSLVGQTILPGKSACVKCFERKLEEENNIDTRKVKKLIVKNRKIGSFAPMCSIIASMIGMESIKVLSRRIVPSNLNRRGEFNILTMDVSYRVYERREDCEWCGENGLYYSMQR